MQVIVANKLARKDSSTGLDVWYKTVVDNVIVRTDKVTNATGAEVSMGESYTILFPFNDKYVPYHKWTNRDDTYTMRISRRWLCCQRFLCNKHLGVCSFLLSSDEGYQTLQAADILNHEIIYDNLYILLNYLEIY